MLITFKSKAAGDINMFSEHAAELLAVMGKQLDPEAAPRGIITADEVPTALAKLKAAADSARAEQRATQDLPGAHLSVSLSQRAYPLIEMLERAAKKPADIVWGV
jgi:hypothetical protein